MDKMKVGCVNKETIWNSNFINIAIINIFLSIAQFMVYTLILKYTYYLGANAAIIGVVTSMFTVTALGIRP